MKQIRVTILIDVPEGVQTPDVDYADSPPEPPEWAAQEIPAQASSGAPRCTQHGTMTFKEGTNKSGKPYAGWFCHAEGCETKPIWSRTK